MKTEHAISNRYFPLQYIFIFLLYNLENKQFASIQKPYFLVMFITIAPSFCIYSDICSEFKQNGNKMLAAFESVVVLLHDKKNCDSKKGHGCGKCWRQEGRKTLEF